MLSINKTTIAVVVAGYGLYYFFNTHNVTPFPPTDDIVRKAIVQADPNYAGYPLQVTKNCWRSSGSVIDKGVFTCTVDFAKGPDSREQEVKIAKRKGKWYWKRD